VTTFRSTRVVLAEGTRPATVRVEDGRIISIGEGLADHDFGEMVIMPGLVDSHVHVNEPGRTEWEGFTTATRAAAAGGTTTIVDMPLNCVPPTTTIEALETKRTSARGAISVDVAFWGGIVPGSEVSVDDLVDAGVCGFKAFLTDSGVPEFPPVTVGTLEALDIEVPLLVHAEADDLLGEPGPTYREYLASRPPQAESVAISRVSGLTGPVHILHVSSAEGVEAIAAGPRLLSGETCPHYLTFTSEDVTGVVFKCAPPIREPLHREALWDALMDGTLAMIVSDHSPAPPGLKRGDFATAWGGIAGLQLRLPLVWSGAVERGLGPSSVAEWLSGAPARLAGLDDRKGAIEVGRDGDLVVFDPDALITVTGSTLHHRHPVTPYEGMTLRGEVVATFLGGVPVLARGTLSEGHGRMLARR
jgi:allantoinase